MTTLVYLTKILTRAYREDEGDPIPTAPVAINTAAVRCAYPRKDNQPGTRITFTDGGGFAVSEDFADVCRYLTTGQSPHEPLRLVE